MQKLGVIAVCAILVVAGCSGKGGSAANGKNAAPAKSQNGAACPVNTSGNTLRGVVKEKISSGGYTYARIDGGTGEIWAAAPECSLAVGDTVCYSNTMPMENFKSKTLNRTFPTVYFSETFSCGGQSAAAEAMAAPHGKIMRQAASASDTMNFSGVAKPAGGNTVAELYAGKKTLVGKNVILRGKVVKINTGIMGTNWVHVRDGSGEKGLNDLTVTTNAIPHPGETVLVEGILEADKNIGAGYLYPLIVENAKVTIEK